MPDSAVNALLLDQSQVGGFDTIRCPDHTATALSRPVDVVRFVTLDDSGVRDSQPCMEIDAALLAGFDERGDDGPPFSTGVAACKRGILPL